MMIEVALLGFDELESHQLKLCSDMDTFGHSGLDLLCPLSPAVQDELFTPFSPLSGQSPEESLLSSPSLGTSLHDASSCLDTFLPAAQQHQQESAGSGQHASQFVVSSCSDCDLSTCPSSQLSDDATNRYRYQKRAKLEWTAELHCKFVEAVESLPADKQVPSRILERMGDWGHGLTRANVASHLQKYRSNRKGVVELPADAATYGCAAGVVMGVPCFPLMQAPPAYAAMLPMMWPAASADTAAEGAAATAAAQPTIPTSTAATTTTAMIPTPNALDSTACAVAGGGDWARLMDLSMPEQPVPAELMRALQDVLAGKRKRAPIGLRLDCAAVMQQWNCGRAV